jgi:hypothetical protein
MGYGTPVFIREDDRIVLKSWKLKLQKELKRQVPISEIIHELLMKDDVMNNAKRCSGKSRYGSKKSKSNK